MKYADSFVAFKELPDEIALAFSITGCTNNCEGCHSPHLLKDDGCEFSGDLVLPYSDYVTAVLFLGGNQHSDFMQIAKGVKSDFPNLKLALYTGDDKVSRGIVELFDIIKVGKFNGKPLTDENTNQRYYVKNKDGIFSDETYRFWNFK